MRKRILLFMALLLLFAGCGDDPQPAGVSRVSTVAEMAAMAAPGDSVEFSGEVSLLGELFCPCFEVTGGGEAAVVWYGMMVGDDGAMADVDVSAISNGDHVVVHGVCQEAPDPGTGNLVVWATSIEKAA